MLSGEFDWLRDSPWRYDEDVGVKRFRLQADPAAEIVDPDQADQTGEAVSEEVIRPKDAKAAAWLALAQSLYGSAEFRFVK